MLNASLLASTAYAADVATDAAAPAGGSPMSMMVIMLAFFGFMYFFMIRPQQKRQKEHAAMLSNIRKGDQIQTNGGLFGKVTAVDSTTLTVEIAPQIRVKIGKGFIARVVTDEKPKGAKDSAADKDSKD